MFGKRRFAGALVAAVLLVVLVAGAALAEPDTRAQTAGPDLYQDFVAKFAANLGVDRDKVVAAFEATKKQILDEAVQQGRLTQDQADKIADRANGIPGLFGGFHGKKQGVKYDFKDFGRGLDGVAKALGLTTDQLKSEFKSGKKLPQIIAEKGLTNDQFHQKMLEIKKEALSQAVSEGKLTQEKADQIIKKMEQRDRKIPPVQANN